MQYTSTKTNDTCDAPAKNAIIRHNMMRAAGLDQSLTHMASLSALILTAIKIRYGVQINIDTIDALLNASMIDVHHVSLLAIKQTIAGLGYGATGYLIDQPLDFRNTTQTVGLALDQNNIYHLVYVHDIQHVYLAYRTDDACVMTLADFSTAYQGREWLVLQ